MTPAHRAEDIRRPRLNGQVEVFADVRKVPHRLDQALARMPRVRAREADSLDSWNGVHFVEELSEVAARIVGRRVVIDDLSEELNLAPP
jgi:hypothetical protein